MGCCEARGLKLEDDFHSISMSFVDQSSKSYDLCPVDKISLLFLKQNGVIAIKDFLKVDPETMSIDQNFAITTVSKDNSYF
jgi:hypothetical protein